MTIQMKKVHPDARLPTLGSSGAAGYDLYACITEPRVLPPGAISKTPTGIAIHIGDYHLCGFIMPRSGLGTSGIVLANTIGLIDSDYQGELLVALKNTGTEPFTIEPGMRIAQLVLIRGVTHPTFKVVDEFDNATSRNIGGFGSTGT